MFNNLDNKKNMKVLLSKESDKNCVRLNNNNLQCIENLNFGGLTLNKYLGWADRVKKISNKICKVI